MTDIPNTSKSSYYLRRIESRPERGGDAPVSQHSLRSIPAWDASYLGSSLLAKRVRKTLAAVEDRINAVATGGVDYNLLEQMVNNTLAGMNLEGLSEAEVNALIAAAVGEFGDTLTAEVATAIQALIDGGQLATGNTTTEQVQALIAAALADLPPGTDEAAVQALIDASLAGVGPIIAQAVAAQAGRFENKLDLNRDTATDEPFVISVNNLTGAQWKAGIDFVTQRAADITVNGKRILTEDDSIGLPPDELNALIAAMVDVVFDNNSAGLVQAVVDFLSTQPNGALTDEQALAVAESLALAQGVVNILGGKPGGGGTLEDVAAVFDNLGTTFQTQLEDAVSSIAVEFQTLLDAIGGKPDSTMTEVQAFFTNMQQAVGEALASIWKAGPDKFTLNVRSANATDKVTIESWQLTPHPPAEARAVDVDIAPYGDGVLTVKGKRVLTVDDALEAGGAGIDQAALEAAVQAATAPLLARIDALETELAKRPTTEYMQEQFGNFNDLLTADISQTAQLALAEQKKLQDLMDAFAYKTNATLADVKVNFIDSVPEYIQQVDQKYNDLINEIVEYVVTTFAEKTAVEAVNGTVTALMQALGGTTPAEVATAMQELFTQLEAAIGEGIEAKIPQLLEALSAHLENVLAIFTSGGTPGQVVTPAQLTQLLADIARDYATKESLLAYAKLDDGSQEINAGLVKARGIQFTINDEVLVPIEFDDYGTRLALIPKNATSVDDAGIVVLHTDLADLVPGSKSKE